MRAPIPDIRERLARVAEPRRPIAATRLEAGEAFLVVTLAPPGLARLGLRAQAAWWETRVHESAYGGLGSQPRYAVLDGDQAAALLRHEALLRRLEAGRFEADTAREIVQGVRPLLDRAVDAFRERRIDEALRWVGEAIGTASRLDAAHAFLRLYVQAYLLRGILLDHLDAQRAIDAYRALIALVARQSICDESVLHAVSEARGAVEQLTPIPVRP